MLNKDYSGSELLGTTTQELVERLKNAASETQLWLILNQYFLSLLGRLKPITPIDVIIREIEKNPFIPISADGILSMADLCTRQLECLFKQRLGVGPKAYLRLMRFSTAHTLKEQSPAMRWTKIAYEAGYYDHMHLIKDFKEFAGITPSGILKEAESSLRFQKILY